MKPDLWGQATTDSDFSTFQNYQKTNRRGTCIPRPLMYKLIRPSRDYCNCVIEKLTPALSDDVMTFPTVIPEPDTLTLPFDTDTVTF